MRIVKGILVAAPNKDDVRHLNLNLADVSYKSYVRWEENGGVDLQLPAFKLTNRQMLWLCIVHAFSYKSHEKAQKDFSKILKLKTTFREAFRCGDITESEKMLLEEHDKRRFYNVLKTYDDE